MGEWELKKNHNSYKKKNLNIFRLYEKIFVVIYVIHFVSEDGIFHK